MTTTALLRIHPDDAFAEGVVVREFAHVQTHDFIMPQTYVLPNAHSNRKQGERGDTDGDAAPSSNIFKSM